MHIYHAGVGLTSQICQSLLHSGQWFCSSAVWAHCGLAPCNPQTLWPLPEAQSEVNTKIKQRHAVNSTAHIYCGFYKPFCWFERGNKIAKESDRLWQMSRFVIVISVGQLMKNTRVWPCVDGHGLNVTQSQTQGLIYFLTRWENNHRDIIWQCLTGKGPVCSHFIFFHFT